MKNEFSLADFLPMLPWEGPPLPRFLRIYWPWAQGEASGAPRPRRMLPPIERIFSGVQESSGTKRVTLYSNIERRETTIERGGNGRISKIVSETHRKVVEGEE